MTATTMTSYALQVLCTNYGSLEYSELLRQIEQYFQITVDLLLQLQEDSRLLVSQRKVESAEGDQAKDSKKVLAVTSLRVCKQFYSKDGCSDVDCPKLHLCRRFFYGICRFNTKRRCWYSHDVHSMHNARLLNASNLLNLDDSHLRVLLLQNDPLLLPGACHLYNKNNGNDDACTFEKCQRLHICQHFLNGKCRFGGKCKRSHDFEKNAYNVLKDQGFESSLIPNLLSIYHNNFEINNPEHAEPKGPAPNFRQFSANRQRNVNSDEICLNFVAKNCRLKARCFKHHFSFPYRWQIFKDRWEDLSNMEQIEKAYCDPNNSGSDGVQFVDFQMMICDSNQVKRLSTPSSVTKPPHVIFTTVWLWYWKNEYHEWIEYGNQAENQRASTVTSTDLEKAYEENNDGLMSFQAGRYEYELRFKDMIQENKSLKTQREVRRRPKYVSEKDLEDIRKRGTTMKTIVPSNWDTSAVTEVGYKLVHLSESSAEYTEIKTLFVKTMNSSTIQKIERIQNISLWEVFQWQKEQMKKNNSGKDVDERLLFHGTDDSIVEAICHQNFDWRICGTNGTAYGKGSYFARDASYSDGYSKSTSASRIMFVARVLVGQFIEGSSSYLRPPSKDGKQNNLYDSCVNNMLNPSIFVVFEKHQIYPQYLIKYCYKATAPPLPVRSYKVVPPPTAVRASHTSVMSSNRNSYGSSGTASHTSVMSSNRNSYGSSGTAYVPPSSHVTSGTSRSHMSGAYIPLSSNATSGNSGTHMSGTFSAPSSYVTSRNSSTHSRSSSPYTSRTQSSSSSSSNTSGGGFISFIQRLFS